MTGSSSVTRRLSLGPWNDAEVRGGRLVVEGPLGGFDADWPGAHDGDPPQGLLRDPDISRTLWARGLLIVTVLVGDRVGYVIHPRLSPPPGPRPDPAGRYLDRHAQLTVGRARRGEVLDQPDDRSWWLSTPASWADVEIIDTRLVESTRRARSAGPQVDTALERAFLADLAWTGMTSPPGPADGWDHASAHVHSQTTLYGRRVVLGRALRPQPLPSGAPRELDTPRGIGALGDRPAFDAVIAARRSRRPVGQESVPRALVEELLRRVVSPLPDGNRAYPSAGDCGELTVVLTAGRVYGLQGGLHRWDADRGALLPVADPRPAGAVLRAAGLVMGSAPPAAVVTILSDVQRVLGRYNSMGYSLLMKNTGILLAHLHLTATRLGIASCLLGTGDARYLASILREDVTEVAALGEMALVSGPRSDADD